MILKYLITLLGPLVFAQAQWEPIFHAKTSQELFEVDRGMLLKSRSELGCKNERQEKLFPRHCIAYAESLAFDPSQSSNLKELLGQLDRLCVNNVSQIQSIPGVEEYLKSAALSEKCKNALVQRQGDLIYRGR